MNATDLTALENEAEALANLEVLVETNEGTYGASEACRAIGTGDPAFANYKIYERVRDGKRRVQGCDPQRAPGYARRFSTELTEAKRRLEDLRARISRAR